MILTPKRREININRKEPSLMKALTRIFITVLALLVAMASASVFAAGSTLTDKKDDHSIDVQAKYVDGTVSPDVYSIDVTWDAMQFTYSTSGTREWNPETHEYTGELTNGWTSDGNTVTVTNHSNRDVKVTFRYEPASGFDGISGTFSVDSDTLSAGTVGNVAGADKVVTALTLSGELAKDTYKFTKIGSVTVSLQ